MPLDFGHRGLTEDDDNGSGKLNERVVRLETHFGYIRRDLDDIKTDQRTLLDRTAKLATTGNLWTIIGTVAAIALAVIAIFVGVLAYLQDAKQAPTIIQMPSVSVPQAPIQPPS